MVMRMAPRTLLCALLCALHQGSCRQQTFRVRPENSSVPEGTTASLRCEVLAASGVVQWVKDGLLLGPQRDMPGFPRYSMGGTQASGQFNLQIESVELEDDGWFQCQAGRSPSSHPIASPTAWLSVLIPPQRPVISDHVGSDSVTWVAGVEVTLTCTATDAKPRAQVQWMRGAEPLPGVEVSVSEGSQPKLFDSVAILRFVPKATDNGVSFSCSAINTALDAPRVTSLRANVHFPPGPPWVEGLEGRPLREGDSLNLRCQSQGGNPLATLQWSKGDEVLLTTWESDEVAVPPLSRSVLALALRPEHNLVALTCEATNLVATAPMTTTVTLHVLFGPAEVTLLGFPEGSGLVEGQALAVACVASASNPPPTIRWWAVGAPASRRQRHHLRGDSCACVTYHLPLGPNGGHVTVSNLTYAVTREHNGVTLTCEAANEAPLHTRAATRVVKVYYRPERVWIEGYQEGRVVCDRPERVWIEGYQEGRVVCDRPERVWIEGYQEGRVVAAGALLRVTCYASGGHPPATLLWTKGSSVVRGGDYRSTGSLASREITVVAAPSDNGALYSCLASNKASSSSGALRNTTRLHVHFPPRYVKVTEAKDGPIHAGTTITFLCQSASSNPACSLSWIKDGQRLQGEAAESHKAEHGGWASSGQIALALSSGDHGKRLTCQATHPLLRERVSAFYKLHVLFAPELQEGQPVTFSVLEKGAALLKIETRANPPEVTVEYLVKNKPDGTAYESRLEVVNATSALDYALFTCSAHNDMGSDSFDIQLVSTSRPDPPTGVRVVAVTDSSATVTWHAGFNGGLEQRFRVRYEAQGVRSARYVDVYPPQATTYTVGGLLHATGYNLSVSAWNRLGHSDYHGVPVGIRTTVGGVKDDSEMIVPPPGTDLPKSGMLLSLPVLVAVVAVVVAVVVANAVCLVACVVRKRRAACVGKKLQDMAVAPNRYAPHEALNPAARRTLLLDSCSEHSYEAYGGTGGSELYSDITGGRSSTLTTQETLSRTDSYYSAVDSWAEQHLYEEATAPSDTSDTSDTARPLYQRAPRRAGLLPVEPIEEEPLDL
ncbi:LOW QUALITY PROTEIN: nephrin [Lampetra fluviatilis]